MEKHAEQERKGCYLDLSLTEQELLESRSVSVIVQTSPSSVPMNLTLETEAGCVFEVKFVLIVKCSKL